MRRVDRQVRAARRLDRQARAWRLGGRLDELGKSRPQAPDDVVQGLEVLEDVHGMLDELRGAVPVCMGDDELDLQAANLCQSVREANKLVLAVAAEDVVAGILHGWQLLRAG